MRLAALGMYDFPFLAAQTDALWAALRTLLPGAPDSLERGRRPDDIWNDPALLLAQTCGYPLMTRLRGAVRLVATPVYDLPGCDGGWHRSFVIVRADDPAQSLADLRRRRAAINAWDSNSGMNLFRAAIAPLAGGEPFFAGVTVTGAHMRSLAAVRSGAADTAAIDCVTFGLHARFSPGDLAGVRVLAETPPTPALPFITAGRATEADIALLRRALRARLPWPGLALAASVELGLDAYQTVLDLERAAAAHGYPVLA